MLASKFEYLPLFQIINTFSSGNLDEFQTLISISISTKETKNMKMKLNDCFILTRENNFQSLLYLSVQYEQYDFVLELFKQKKIDINEVGMEYFEKGGIEKKEYSYGDSNRNGPTGFVKKATGGMVTGAVIGGIASYPIFGIAGVVVGGMIGGTVGIVHNTKEYKIKKKVYETDKAFLLACKKGLGKVVALFLIFSIIRKVKIKEVDLEEGRKLFDDYNKTTQKISRGGLIGKVKNNGLKGAIYKDLFKEYNENVNKFRVKYIKELKISIVLTRLWILFNKDLSFEGNILHKNGKGSIFYEKKIGKKIKKLIYYDGEFNNGLKHGKGKLFGMIFKNKNKIIYRGCFKNDKKHGIGRKFTYNKNDKSGELEQKILIGKWKNDKFVEEVDFKDTVKQIDKKLFKKIRNNVLGAPLEKRKQMMIKGKGSLRDSFAEGVYKYKNYIFMHFKKENLNIFMKEYGKIWDLGEYHPNIIKMISMSFDEPCVIVMEYFGGSDVLQFIGDNLKKGELIEFKEKIWIIKEVCQAFEEFHKNNIIYRDLSWKSVLFEKTPQKRVKLLPPKISGLQTSDKITEFSSPEINTKNYSYKSNIYSLGIMMYQLLFEKLDVYDIMRHQPDKLELLQKVVKGKRPIIPQTSLIEKENPWILNELMKKMWHQSPKSRPTITEIIDIINLNFHDDNKTTQFQKKKKGKDGNI